VLWVVLWERGKDLYILIVSLYYCDITVPPSVTVIWCYNYVTLYWDTLMLQYCNTVMYSTVTIL